MSLLSSNIDNVRSLADDDADHYMLQDLQLAAELGKTLLERNKELENIIKANQATIEEQAQEIEYMKKQTAALREVNDSRLKIYEQLEVSIQDLERANHRLVLENTSDKKLIKSQCSTIESLEARCEELEKRIEEINEQHESLLRQQTASQSTNTAQTQTALWKSSVTQTGSTQQNAALSGQKVSQEPSSSASSSSVRQLSSNLTADEEVTELLRQLQEARSQRTREQKKVSELEQQLSTLLQENSSLEEQLNVWRGKAQDVKNLQEEINTLEEVRRGHLCGRCLRGMDSKTHDEITVMLNQEEYDDISMAETLMADTQREPVSVNQQGASDKDAVRSDLTNPYRVLVEKYQALLEVQRRSCLRKKDTVASHCMSLQEELEMSGEFNNFQNSACESEIHQESTTKPRGKSNEILTKKSFSATPTDFSEAETSSSGFSDETSNKATQTEGRSGSFLCSIDDGEDCKLSIYDDISPFESRFQKTPEYRQTFSQIFSVLKRAAEAKDEGEKLPLLDDSTSSSASQQQQPSVLQEEAPSETTDDNQSVVSSALSSTVSEPIYGAQIVKEQSNETPIPAPCAEKNWKNGGGNQLSGASRLDYLSINVSKKPAKKHGGRKFANNYRLATPDSVPSTNSKFNVTQQQNSNGGKGKFRPLNGTEQNHLKSREWRNATRRGLDNSYQARNNGEQQQHNTSFGFKHYKPSTASEEVARLRRLEMTYAEVLLLPSKSKTSDHHRRS